MLGTMIDPVIHTQSFLPKSQLDSHLQAHSTTLSTRKRIWHVLTHTKSRKAYAKSSHGRANLATWTLVEIQFVSYLYLCMHLSSVA